MDPRVMIITGAGASVNLGADGTRLPMMGAWAASLVEELKYAAELIGLREDMPGDQFEAALGRFLAFSEALSAVEPLHKFGAFENVIREPGEVAHGNDSDTWVRLAHRNVEAVRTAIHRNLYEQFSQVRIDDNAARSAYAKLHRQIRSAFRGDGPVFLAHVTTNFDHAIEAAIDNAEPGDYPHQVLTGFAHVGGGRREPWAPNLLTYSRNSDDEAPVLHLHGAIGWYFTDAGDGIFRRNTDEEIVPGLTPALLLPDDKKDVGRFPPPLKAVWQQFNELLTNSTHVLIVGHSLHDAHLVQALHRSGKPVAIVVYTPAAETDGFDEKTSPEALAFAKLLPEASLIPGEFASGTDMPIEPHRLGEWLRTHAIAQEIPR